MKTAFLPIFMVLFLSPFAGAETVPSTNIQKAIDDIGGAFERLIPTQSLDANVLSRALDEIEVDIQKWSVISPNMWMAGRFMPLFHRVATNMISQSRIASIDSKQLQQLCGKSEKLDRICMQMKAFYVPELHRIYILDQVIDQPLFKSILFHELLHAYQYAVRLPMDIYQLRLEMPAATDEVLLQSISFLYEAQANYQSFQLYEPKIWRSQHSSRVYQFITGMGKAFSALFTLGLSMQLGKNTYNDHLPAVDRRTGYRQGNIEVAYRSAFFLSEPILNESFKFHFNMNSNVDLGYHKKFCASISRSYFNGLPFLEKNLDQSQKHFVKLHDQYYSFLLNTDKQDVYDLACLSELQDVLGEKIPPLFAWTHFDKTKLRKCPYPVEALSNDNLSGIADLFLKNIKNKNPFSLVRPGTEGSKPALLVQPQIEILPKVKKINAPKGDDE